MSKRVSGPVLVAALLFAAACGSSSSGGGTGGSTTGGGTGGSTTGGGTGGSTTGGGTGGSTTGGGTGGSPGGTECGNFPACVSDLARTCVPMGACTQQMTGSLLSPGTNTCYANGVKILSTTTIDITTASGVSSSRFLKSDGSLCYSWDAALGTGSMTTMLTIKNAAGATVATGTVDNNGDMTIMCGGQSYVVTDRGSCGGPVGAGGASGGCATGSCM